jgi:hypothetical protein
MQLAPVGGDSGGYFSMPFESAPFMFRGKTLKFRESVKIVSPVRCRNQITLSVDGAPYAAYSIGWWEKSTTAPSN